MSGFGICFALFSSVEELSQGQCGKSVAALLVGAAIYVVIGRNKVE